MESRTVQTNLESRKYERATKKPDNSNKGHEQRKNKVKLSYLQEEVKYLKRTLDILLKRK